MQTDPTNILTRAIEQARSQYAHVLDPMPEGYHLVDFSWRVLYLNPMAECNGRKPAAEVIGQGVMDCYPELASTRMLALVQRAMDERVVLSDELEYEFEDGSVGWFSQTVYPVAEGLLVKNVDISERVWARNALEEKADLFLRTQRIGRIGSYSWHFDSKTVDWSPEVYRIYGFSPNQTITTEMLAARNHPEDASRVEQWVERCHQAKLAEPLTYRIRRSDGKTRWLEALGEFELDSQGGPLRMVGTVQDITERYENERILREQEAQLRLTTERLEMAVNAGHVGLWEWDLETHSVYFSSQWKRQLGFEDEEIGDAFSEFFDRLHDEDRERVGRRIDEFLSREDDEFNIEFRLCHKDGSFRHVVAQATEVRDAEGRRTKLMGSQIDVTEWVELQQQFLQSQKMESLGRLAGGVAHDFNNLLTVILGVADLTLNQLGEDDAMRRNLESIQRAGVRASGLTRQLLTFSRRQIMKLETVNIDSLISEMESMLQRLIGESVDLNYSPGTHIGSIRFDAGQIEQIIMNLSINASDAMPRGGKLTIRTRDRMISEALGAELSLDAGRYVQITVSDTGTGIPPEALDHIFEPFFSTKAADKGTGLGLATVYGIARQAGGNVLVSSTLGEGSAFDVFLPVSEVENEQSRSEAPGGLARGEETVLIVEDESSVLDLASEVLKSSGYRVISAESVDQARGVLKDAASPVDLLLTDIVMPDLNGRELAEQFQSGLPEMKVLYMSGYTDDVILRNGISEEKVSFIGKPFTAIELSNKIRQVLDAD